jgi:protoheme ferro-lyase
VETLGEIDHEAREQAERVGIAQFEMVPGLNDSPRFIRALGELVRETIQDGKLKMQDDETERFVAAD